MNLSFVNDLMDVVVRNNWEYDEHTPEISRSMFTTLMIVNHAHPDTKFADRWLREVYINGALEDVMPYEDFEDFMYEYLV